MLRSIVAAVVLLASLSVNAAEYFASDGMNFVRLTDKPCEDAAVMAKIPPGLQHLKWGAGSAIWEGKPYPLCYTIRPPYAVLQYADGDGGAVPLRDLKEAQPGI